MNAIIYTRFSPRKNADKSESCETQESICRRFAEEKGYTVTEVFFDRDVSGADEFREQLWQAIDSLAKNSILIVFKRDRLARNVYLAEQINRAVKSKGATIVAISGDVVGDGNEQTLVRQIVAAVAEYERKMIGARTSYAMRQHQRDGKRMGRFAPYGYKFNPEDSSALIEASGEQEALVALKSMHKAGMNPNAIMIKLNESYAHVARSGKWNRKRVQKIIERTST